MASKNVKPDHSGSVSKSRNGGRTEAKNAARHARPRDDRTEIDWDPPFTATERALSDLVDQSGTPIATRSYAVGDDGTVVLDDDWSDLTFEEAVERVADLLRRSETRRTVTVRLEDDE